MVAKVGPLILAFFEFKLKFSFHFQLTRSFKIDHFRNTIDFKLHKCAVFFTSVLCHFSVAEAHTLAVFVDSFALLHICREASADV